MSSIFLFSKINSLILISSKEKESDFTSIPSWMLSIQKEPQKVFFLEDQQCKFSSQNLKCNELIFNLKAHLLFLIVRGSKILRISFFIFYYC